MSRPNCCAEVRTTMGRYRPCSKPGSVERGGKYYCHVHDPEEVKRRRQRATRKGNIRWLEKRRQISGNILYGFVGELLRVINDPPSPERDEVIRKAREIHERLGDPT